MLSAGTLKCLSCKRTVPSSKTDPTDGPALCDDCAAEVLTIYRLSLCEHNSPGSSTSCGCGDGTSKSVGRGKSKTFAAQWVIVKLIGFGTQFVPLQEGRMEAVHLELLADQCRLNERPCITNAMCAACLSAGLAVGLADLYGGAPGGGAAGGPATPGRAPLRDKVHAQYWPSSLTFKSCDLFRRGAWRPYTWSCWRTSGAWTSACALQAPCAPPATVAACSSPSCARTGSVRCAVSPSAAPRSVAGARATATC